LIHTVDLSVFFIAWGLMWIGMLRFRLQLAYDVELFKVDRSVLMRQQAKVIFLSSLGGALEFYDFVVFAVFAHYLGEAFFPHQDHRVQLLSAFALFAVGYFIRPLGGIIFSHYGDKFGRKQSFAVSISCMAISTLLMGLVPTYQSWGISASLIFVALRMIQGMAIGGEVPGAITFVSEHVRKRPGFACGMVFMFINLGIFLADSVHALLSACLSTADFMHYGWRIAFILGGLLAIVSYFLRKKLEETPAFRHARETQVAVPLFHLLARHRMTVLAGILLTSLGASLVSLLFLYMVSYLDVIHGYPAEQVTKLTLWSLVVFSLMVFVVGMISDYVGRKKIILLGSLLFITLSVSFFQQIQLHSEHVLVYFILAGVVASLITACFPVVLAESFPVAVRYTGVALCYNVGFAVFGGLSPLVATFLIHMTHRLESPAYILLAAGVLSLLALLILGRKPAVL
jgi:MFS family permease